MLHSIREGAVALDRTGRIRLLNDEAQRLLGLGPDAAGRPIDDVLSRGRTADVLAGRVVGDDLLTPAVTDHRPAAATTSPAFPGPATPPPPRSARGPRSPHAWRRRVARVM